MYDMKNLTKLKKLEELAPEAFKGFVGMVAAGGLGETLNAMLADKSIYRSPEALGLAYERPEAVSDDTIETYVRPHVCSPQRTHDLERFVNAFDCRHTVAIESALRQLPAPTLIAWGTDDIFFDVKWSHWLEKTIHGTKRRVEFRDARIFFPEERPSEFNDEVRAHWVAIPQKHVAQL